MKKYAIVTMTGEDGGAATYFDTEKEARAAAKEKAENDWYEKADLRNMHEEVYECEVDDDGEEIDFIDSIVDFPYLQKFTVAFGYGENVQQVNEYQTMGTTEARTAYKAAEEFWNGLEPEEEKNIIFQVYPKDEYNATSYFSEEDFR